MRPLIPLATAFALLLAGCADAESPYDDPATTWVAADFAGATLSFPEPGRIAGDAPCNRYGATQTAEYPAFHAEGIFSTKMACPDLGLEASFFDALGKATEARREGDTLLLLDGAEALIRFTSGE